MMSSRFDGQVTTALQISIVAFLKPALFDQAFQLLPGVSKKIDSMGETGVVQAPTSGCRHAPKVNNGLE
ncbi:MAG: hypothetical protein O7G83_01730 [Proteobacteria bacterium]|nr:hypothetical protein [Pseudomonadota bacterium]MCZ6895865.1 hypothetical protein [Gammaproteobacteria bacterium]